MKRDTQRSKVYGWERQFFTKPTDQEMTLSECATLANKVSKHFKMWDVRIKDGRGTRSAYSYGGAIGLPKWARQPVVVLHEMAHEVHRKVGRYRQAVHGREFVGIHMYLLVKFGGFSINELVKSANDSRVDFVSMATVREWVRKARS